ncbi:MULTISPECIES: polysaccharide deacetylase family protein [Bacillus]|uniref:polysaccharide deacetylase family protein n=1 Tax=Bacillus TaxID=1386 RepID=UPI0002EFF890|nr:MULTISPECIES: polysaccharide deacetylase family protein [Bacillus]
MKWFTIIYFGFLLVFLPNHAYGVKKVPILVYHSIDEFSGHGSKELYVTPNNFEKQIMYLREHGFTLLTFEHWTEIDKVKKPIFLTFDDGYKNNLNAYIILQKLKSEQFTPVATFFVISEFIGQRNRLSKSDLKMLAKSGVISVQSHTVTHPDLTKIGHVSYELKDSKMSIQQITGKPVIALAYPYGSFNENVISDTKKYYSFGLTTIPEYYLVGEKVDKQYVLPRIYIKYSTTLDEFMTIVEGKM